MEDTLVPIALFAIAPLIVWAVVAYRYKTKKAVMAVLESMTQKGESRNRSPHPSRCGSGFLAPRLW